jgi:phosphohistidine phosphatase
MRTLLLVRHAKSSWKDSELADHDRPLNSRGKREAPLVGAWLLEHKLVPDLLISSTALRARKTAEKVARACGYDRAIQLAPELYEAGRDAYVQVPREFAGACRRVLLVGHNPAVEETLERLLGRYVEMGTAAVAHLRLDIADWSEFTWESPCRLVDVWRPEAARRGG